MREFHLLTLVLVFAVPAAQTRGDEATDARKLGVRANECLAKNQHDEALKLAEQAIRLDPKAPWYHSIAGAAHWRLKQFPAGLRECETAIRLASGKEDTWYYHMAGENAYSLLDLPLARRYFRQAVSQGETRELGGNFAVAKSRLDALTEKTFAFEWVLQPSKAPALKRADGTYLIPIPANTYPFQKVNQMTVTGAASYQAEDFVGNEALAVKPKGDNPVRIQFRITMTPYAYKDALAKYRPNLAIPDEARKYLGKSEWIDPKSPKLLGIVKPLRRDNPVETVEQILAFERSRLTFVEGSTFKSAEDVLEQGKAVCFGWSAAFTGLCRSAGIPARMVDVLAADYPSSKFGFHTYCEFYVPGAGWIPIEPQPGGMVGIPSADQVRLYHYALDRKWEGSNANEIHPLCTLNRLGGVKVKFVVEKK